MASTMMFLVGLLFVCSTFFSGVTAQTAGAGLWSVSLSANPPVSPPTSWASIPQNYPQMEWDSLSNCFTVEAWIYWKGPTPNVTREVIVSRHPGDNALDARAHFGIGLSPNPLNASEWNIGAWSGCYVGLGYSLTSARAFSGTSTGFVIQPGMWTHVAFAVGGDATFLPLAIGQLYVQGDLQDSNFWNSAQCGERFGIPWDRNSNDIRLGWYDNQDMGISAGNPNSVYGFNGYVDELQFFKRVRTADEIYRDFTFSYELNGSEDGVIYYQLNEGPTSTQFYKKKNATASGRDAISNGIGPKGILVPGNSNQWVQGTGLQINQRITISGKTNFNTASFQLLASQEVLPLTFTITSFSPDLAPLIARKEVIIYSTDRPTVLPITTIPTVLSSPNLGVLVNCSDGNCTNLSGNLFFGFRANNSTANVKIDVIPPCPSNKYDACGVCQGDNRTCMCLCYHGYRSEYLNFKLMQFGVDQTLARINMTLNALSNVLSKIQTIKAADASVQPALVRQLQLHKDFNTCHSTYCQSFGPWKSKFDALFPLAEPTGLPFDKCSCDPDPSMNI
eukprot:TRINITY_DN2464_c0_g1_i1.p1 TRINITY_DN2464_c0_g1~~TRINITY_DN2464_c0_g1_i1.p1  ORF type:complete len:562 (-),score=167.16 TRINITY_DN2464_c0_g1_i1:207-1892(-)